MSILRFYSHFAAAFGTCWLVWSSPAFIGRPFRINRDEFFGLIAISLGYAVIRTVNDMVKRVFASQDFQESNGRAADV